METRRNTVESSSAAYSERKLPFLVQRMLNTLHVRYSAFLSDSTRREKFYQILIVMMLIVCGAAARLLPHEANFAPIAAMALFGAVYLKPKHALLIPFAALFISDLFLGFDSLNSRLSVYGAFLIVGLIGLTVRRHKNALTIVGGSLLGSIVFFLVTNFVFFYPPVMYSHDLAGQLSSYYNALPFFRGTLLGDLFYTGVFFGIYELATVLGSRKNLALEG